MEFRCLDFEMNQGLTKKYKNKMSRRVKIHIINILRNSAIHQRAYYIT